jgi:hypothetical protein
LGREGRGLADPGRWMKPLDRDSKAQTAPIMSLATD